MSVRRIMDLVRTDRITAAQGALLLQLRDDIKRARRPWWRKTASFVARLVFG